MSQTDRHTYWQTEKWSQ